MIKLLKEVFGKKHNMLKMAIIFLAIVAIVYLMRNNVMEGFDSSDAMDKPAFVAFTAEWCGHCKKLKPEWKKLQDDNKTSIIINLDNDEHKELHKKHKVEGFPTIKYFPKGLNDPKSAVDYNGARDKDSMEKFLKSQ